MDERIISATRFLGITLLLNMILAGSRWLIAPVTGERVIWLQFVVAIVIALIFGLATYLVHGRMGSGAVITAVGSIVLLNWLSGLPLWNTWLWGLALCSLLVPVLLIAARPMILPISGQMLLVTVLAVLAGLWWATWTADLLFDGGRWVLLLTGLLALLWSWMWHMQPVHEQWVYTAVAFIALLQLAVGSFFLPFSVGVNSMLFAGVFGFVCVCCVWPSKQKTTLSAE